MATIKHKITTVEKIDIKASLVKDDLTILLDDNDESIEVESLLSRFRGKLINISISEKTEEVVEDSFEESFDD